MAKNEKTARGFTLIELLVVVVVIATLMGLVFRLAGVGGDQKNRNATIARLQKLEFALSGYFAAFGTYPPVPLHGSRDIFCAVNDYGIQLMEGEDSSQKLEWTRVRAACLSQPMAVEFPYNSEDSFYKETLSIRASKSGVGSSVDLLSSAGGGFPNRDQLKDNFSKRQTTMWQEAQIFKFGVLSFLLPRYAFMIAGPKEFYDGDTYSLPWQSQNELKSLFNFSNGRQLYSKWENLQEQTKQRSSQTTFSSADEKNIKMVLLQPSQAVCARWMEALDGIIEGGETFFGVNTRTDHDDSRDYMHNVDPKEVTVKQSHPYYVASRNGPQSGGGGNIYALNGMSIRDAWGEEIFYYSPPPYQSYRVWSAGPNRKTIPPWVELKDLSNKQGESGDKGGMDTAAKWISDDIAGLSTPAD